jgi:hypothetical protein
MNKKAQITACHFVIAGSCHYNLRADVPAVYFTAQVTQFNGAGFIFGGILT